MLSRRAPDTRIILLLIVLLFLAVVAVGWAMRAGRVDANTAPTPLSGATAPVPPVTPPQP